MLAFLSGFIEDLACVGLLGFARVPLRVSIRYPQGFGLIGLLGFRVLRFGIYGLGFRANSNRV